MIRPGLVLAGLVILLGSSSASAQNSATTKAIGPAERAALFPSRSMIDKGRTIAESSCSRCHGMDGINSDELQPNLAGQRTVYLYRVIQAYQDGHRMDDSMGHASGFLNEEGMFSVAAYYASLPPVRRLPAEVTAEVTANDPFSDIQPALKKCIKCHTETGNSKQAGMPNLTAQDPEYFVSAMEAYASGERVHKMMKKLAGNLDGQTLKTMGIYFALQQPARSEDRGKGDEMSGRKLAEDCANCHGDDGNASESDVPSLAGQDAKYFVKAMNAYLEGERKEKSMFKAVDGLAPQDLADLAAFYAAREPARRNVRAPLTNQQWVARCERCHGLDGNSTDPRFPMLAGQNQPYLENALQAYAATERDSSAMHAMASPLSKTNIKYLAHYFSTQEPKSVVYMQLPCAEPGEEPGAD